MCHYTEYKLSALQVRTSEENKLNATTQQFITAKIIYHSYWWQEERRFRSQEHVVGVSIENLQKIYIWTADITENMINIFSKFVC